MGGEFGEWIHIYVWLSPSASLPETIKAIITTQNKKWNKNVSPSYIEKTHTHTHTHTHTESWVRFIQNNGNFWVAELAGKFYSFYVNSKLATEVGATYIITANEKEVPLPEQDLTNSYFHRVGRSKPANSSHCMLQSNSSSSSFRSTFLSTSLHRGTAAFSKAHFAQLLTYILTRPVPKACMGQVRK